MKLYPVKIPKILQRLFPSYRWCFQPIQKEIYLTFDDGPTPKITNFVLDQLKEYRAKATFFCIGKNVKKHPKIYHKILKEGHAVGNHTFNHLNSFWTKKEAYAANVKRASAKIDSKLFRPPYGKLKYSHGRLLQSNGYKVIMWDVLSGDFDRSLSPEKCLENVLKGVRNGSIVVMHDSEKSRNKVIYVLPKVLAHYTKEGFLFKAIV